MDQGQVGIMIAAGVADWALVYFWIRGYWWLAIPVSILRGPATEADLSGWPASIPFHDRAFLVKPMTDSHALLREPVNQYTSFFLGDLRRSGSEWTLTLRVRPLFPILVLWVFFFMPAFITVITTVVLLYAFAGNLRGYRKELSEILDRQRPLGDGSAIKEEKQ